MNKLPRTFLATVAIIIGVAFIVLQDPPHHICDTQIERFQHKQSQLGDWDKRTETCKETNSPGGCYAVFSHLRGTLRNFYLVDKQCIAPLSQKSNVKNLILEGMELMVRLAWREKSFEGKVDKFNWLGPSDMNLFCKLKDRLIVFYGRNTFINFEKTLLETLSSNEKANPEVVRKKSILSEYCANYR